MLPSGVRGCLSGCGRVLPRRGKRWGMMQSLWPSSREGENKAKKVAEVPPPPPPPPWYRRWMLLVSSLPPRLLDSLRSLSVRRSVSNYGTALHQPTRQAPWWNVWRRLTGPSTPVPEPTQRANSLFVSWRYVADGTVTMLSGAYNILPSAKRAVLGPLRNLIRLTDPLVYARWRPPPRNLFDAQDVDIVNSKMLVFLGKRPLSGQWLGYQHILRFCNAEHVGVKVILLSRWWGERVLYFDFLPALDGDFSKFRGEVSAKIQENMLLPEEWAFVGSSSRSLREVKHFNKRFMSRDYSLGKNDCRDYSSALVSFLTGEEIAPGFITAYIRDAVAAHGKASVDDMIRFVRQKRKEQLQLQRSGGQRWSWQNLVWGSASSVLTGSVRGLAWMRRRLVGPPADTAARAVTDKRDADDQ